LNEPKPSTMMMTGVPATSITLTRDLLPMPIVSSLQASSAPVQLARTYSRVSKLEPTVSMV
jgi:hypothetical protein